MDNLKKRKLRAEILCDSQCTISLLKNQVIHERTKHIDIWMHYIGDIKVQGILEVKKVATEDNPTDMLTKVVPSTDIYHCVNLVKVNSKEH